MQSAGLRPGAQRAAAAGGNLIADTPRENPRPRNERPRCSERHSTSGSDQLSGPGADCVSGVVAHRGRQAFACRWNPSPRAAPRDWCRLVGVLIACTRRCRWSLWGSRVRTMRPWPLPSFRTRPNRARALERRREPPPAPWSRPWPTGECSRAGCRRARRRSPRETPRS